MIGAFRIEAYVIASADGMLADATRVQPASLHFAADQRHFEQGLDRADVVVNGRHSAEGDPNRDEPSSTGRDPASREPCSGPPTILRARLWNPAGASLEAACADLSLKTGTIAVIGGPQVFTLFLKLGYDCFYLSRAIDVRLPGGLPVFSREISDGDPDAALSAAGLTPRPAISLEDGLTLTDWLRPH